MSESQENMSAAADLKSSIRGRERWLALTAVFAYVVLSVASSLTKRPWSDEGWFANAPLNLVTKGWMGTTVVEQAGHPFLNGIDRYTYWVMPLHLVLQAAWYKIFGFSLLTMRSLSLLFGLVALGSWFLIMRALSQSNQVATLTVVLLIPYVVAATAWSFYILKSPNLFLAQFRGNATADDRLGTLTAPLAGLRREIMERYLIGFGLGPHSVGNSGPIRLKALILLAYIIAIVGSFLVKD